MNDSSEMKPLANVQGDPWLIMFAATQAAEMQDIPISAIHMWFIDGALSGGYRMVEP